MSAFSAKRRILSLWLPRLPIDRIKRLQAASQNILAKKNSSSEGQVEEAASVQCVLGERAPKASQIDDAPHHTDSLFSPPLRGRAREGDSQDQQRLPPPPSLTSRASSARLGPHKGGGNETATLNAPRVVVIKENNALQIYSLDDAAARHGLSVGLPLANARAICPQLQVHDADIAADAKTLNDIADWCDRFTPLVALDSVDGLYLDITGCAHLFGGETRLLKLLCDALTARGFTVSAAIASTPVCARTMNRHTHGHIIADGEEAAAVGPLPIFALGASDAITHGLRRAGLKTIGDVALRARHEITARFGAEFTTRLEQALGQGDAPISPRKPLPDYIVEQRFAEPVATEPVIAATLSRLATTLVASMEKQGKGARRLEAGFFRTDGVVRTLVVDTGQPVTRPAIIDRLFRERLDSLSDPLDPGFGFDLIRLSAGRTEIVVQQQRDLDSNVHDNDALSALIDRIAARIGGRRVVVHLPQDTHIPEYAVLAAPAQHNLAVAISSDWPARIDGEPPLRPLRLFDRPEPITVPLATIPDGPPHQFTWRRAQHAVVRVEGPERIAMEWWRPDGKALTRDYFRVEDTEGLRFWIYRDGLFGTELRDAAGNPKPACWFMHGLFA